MIINFMMTLFVCLFVNFVSKANHKPALTLFKHKSLLIYGYVRQSSTLPIIIPLLIQYQRIYENKV